MKRIKEEAMKLDGRWATSYIKNEKLNKEHFEIRLVENNKLSTRGLLIQKLGDKVDISELFGNHVNHVMNNFFTYNNRDKLIFLVGKLVADKIGVTVEVVKRDNHVDFKINDIPVFVLNMSNRNGKYVITQRAVEKAYEVFNQCLKNLFEIRKEEWVEIRDLQSAIVIHLIGE